MVNDSGAIEAALAAVRRRIASPAWADDFLRFPPPVGPELDGLAAGDPSWAAARAETLAALRAIRPVRKLAVLCMARDEAPYLPEFIAHYRAIGAERIFIYSNDNSDGTDALLRWFAGAAPVMPIFTTAAKGVNIQRKNYEHALLMLPELRLFEWVALVDADEFLRPAARFGHRLTEMLDAAPPDTDAILFPWRWRLWDRAFARAPGLLAERYPHAAIHNSFKPVFRPARVTSLRDIHAPRLEAGGIFRDTAFAPIAGGKLWAPNSPKTDEGGWIDHYWAKSFEEFLVKKRRGDSLASADGAFQRDLSLFFTWTAPLTPETLMPVSAAMIEAVKTGLAAFEARPSYQALNAKLTAAYDGYAATIRGNPDIRQLYSDHMARYPDQK
jgi:hypothetical protein